MKANGLYRGAAACALALGVAAVACACNVPVFRFALERWSADAYRVVVFHRGPLTEAELTLIAPLEEQQDRRTANMAVRTVDVSELEAAEGDQAAADREFLASVTNVTFPCIAVQYPAYLRIPKPVSLRPLDKAAVEKILDSPARKELVRRLAEGQTAVWIVLESGDALKDDEAAALLDFELKGLEKSLELPVLSASPDDALATNLPLEVKFSVLRAPRNSADESTLVGMLLGSEPDLVDLPDPMVFPVFGRGRALLPLVGAGITPKNIQDAAEFLAGPCSCEVKEQNPGFDLLLAADWDVLLSPNGVPLASVVPAAEEPKEAELVPIPAGAAAKEAGTDIQDATTMPVSAAAPAASAMPVAASSREVVTTVFPVFPIAALVGGLAIGGFLVITLIVTLSGGARGRRAE